MTKTAKKTQLRPLGNRVLVRYLEAEESLAGGIILPDNAKKEQKQAEVIAIGTGKKDKNGKEIPFSVAVGDTVLLEKYSGQEVTIDDEAFVIVKADDIIATIEK